MATPAKAPGTPPPPTTKRLKQRKVLLMGKSGAGKTSMRSIIFSNYVAKDVRRLGATIDVEHSNIRFMGNLTLNLWDCGGQDGFTENYLTSQREHVFSGVAVLIFVFDVESPAFAADVVSYGNIIRALAEGSPQANVFVLVHKMDLVAPAHRSRIFDEKTAHIRGATEEESPHFAESLEFHPTSIWDQTLYKAWTQIIHRLIPNAASLEVLLGKLASAIGARELILYERTTCLAVTHVTRALEEHNPIADRFESLSGMFKRHKQALARHTSLPASTSQLKSLHVHNPRFSLFVLRLTENTNLAVVVPPSQGGFEAALANVVLARPWFVELDVSAGTGSGGGSKASGAAAATGSTGTGP